jgi:hypothetical protein
VSPKSGEDRMIWNYNKKGDFIVRSAYHLAKDKYEIDKGSCSNRDCKKSLWKAIWMIEGPKATKSFFCGKHAVIYWQPRTSSLRNTSRRTLDVVIS